MLEKLNVNELRKVDMAKVKSGAKAYATQAKEYAKIMGTKAADQAKYISAKRVAVAGRSVNPFLLGAAAVALIGMSYLLLRRRNKTRFAGINKMKVQDYPVK